MCFRTSLLVITVLGVYLLQSIPTHLPLLNSNEISSKTVLTNGFQHDWGYAGCAERGSGQNPGGGFGS